MLPGVGDFLLGIAPFGTDGNDDITGPHVAAGFGQRRRFPFIGKDAAPVGISVDKIRKGHDRCHIGHVVAAALLSPFQCQPLPPFKPGLLPFII